MGARLLLKVLPVMVAVVVALDLTWLGVVMTDFYRAQLGHLMADRIVWAAAIVFYPLYASGLLYFAVRPALAARSLSKALFLGASLGLFAYGTYDLTNHATLKSWPLIVTLVDMTWGMVLSALVASAGFMSARAWGARSYPQGLSG